MRERSANAVQLFQAVSEIFITWSKSLVNILMANLLEKKTYLVPYHLSVSYLMQLE